MKEKIIAMNLRVICVSVDLMEMGEFLVWKKKNLRVE